MLLDDVERKQFGQPVLRDVLDQPAFVVDASRDVTHPEDLAARVQRMG